MVGGVPPFPLQVSPSLGKITVLLAHAQWLAGAIWWKAPLPDWTANKQSKRAAESPRRRSRSGLSAAQAPAEPTVPKQSS
jgi:hypothetical protein